jgi:hypothetical protein
MVQSTAKTVESYLDELSEERRAVVKKVREVIRKNLPKGYEECIGHGMIAYVVPLSRYPDTYNGEALAYAGLAAQKNNYSLYLMGCYMDPPTDAALKAAFRKAGKKLDMGKSCLRFKSLDDLPLDAIATVIASTPVDKLLKLHEKARAK